MRAFLLAAGKGTRISKKIKEIPKCCLKIDGQPLIAKTVDMLEQQGIKCIAITGYKHEIVENALKDKKVDMVYNPFFDVTNSIASMYLAKDYLVDEDTIIANADVYWEKDILCELIKSENGITLLGDKEHVVDGDYFLLEKDGILQKYGKELSLSERNTEYVGVGYVKKEYIHRFKNRLQELIYAQQHNLWWENVLYSLSKEEEIHVLDVKGKYWSEIDYIDDYLKICEYVLRHKKL